MKKVILFGLLLAGATLTGVAQDPGLQQAIKNANEQCSQMGAGRAVPSNAHEAHGSQTYTTSTEQRGAVNTYNGSANAGGSAKIVGAMSGSAGVSGGVSRQGSQSNTSSEGQGTFYYKCDDK